MIRNFLQFFKFFFKLYTEECGFLMKIFMRTHANGDDKTTSFKCLIIKIVEIIFIILFILTIIKINLILAKLIRTLTGRSKKIFQQDAELKELINSDDKENEEGTIPIANESEWDLLPAHEIV